jgi:hypothetical protein
VARKEVIARGIRLLTSYDAWKATRSNSFAHSPELPSYNPEELRRRIRLHSQLARNGCEHDAIRRKLQCDLGTDALWPGTGVSGTTASFSDGDVHLLAEIRDQIVRLRMHESNRD